MSRKDPCIYMRIPQELKAWLQEQAQASRRSLTAELVHRLENSRQMEQAKHEKQA